MCRANLPSSLAAPPHVVLAYPRRLCASLLLHASAANFLPSRRHLHLPPVSGIMRACPPSTPRPFYLALPPPCRCTPLPAWEPTSRAGEAAMTTVNIALPLSLPLSSSLPTAGRPRRQHKSSADVAIAAPGSSQGHGLQPRDLGEKRKAMSLLSLWPRSFWWPAQEVARRRRERGGGWWCGSGGRRPCRPCPRSDVGAISLIETNVNARR